MTAPDAMYFELYLGDEILDVIGETILDTASNTITDLSGWISIVDDVMTSMPIVIFQGQRSGYEADDRVAESGTIRFTLDNSANNSAGIVGYYSPDHQNVRGNFGLGVKVRVGLNKDGTTQWISQGKIVSIEPTPGSLNLKTVDVVAADWIDIAVSTNMPWLSMSELQDLSDDEIIQLILDNIDDPPDSTDFDTGSYVYPYPLNDIVDGRETIMTILQRLTKNGLGRIYIVGNTTSGEVLKYISFDTLFTGGTAIATFDNDFEEMQVSRQAYQRAKRVNVKTGNLSEYGATSTTLIYSLPSDSIIVPAGESVEFIADFKDVDGIVDAGAEVSAIRAGFLGDFYYSGAGGTGTNLYSSFSTSYSVDGVNSIRVVLINTGVVDGYVYRYDVYGKILYSTGIYSYLTEDTSIPEGQGKTIDWDMLFQNSYAAAKEIGDLLMDLHGQDITEIKSLTFTPTLNADNYEKMTAIKPGEIVHVTDDVTGLDVDVLAVGFELRIWNNGNYMTETVYVSRTI